MTFGEKKTPTCSNQAVKDPEGKSRLMKSLRGGMRSRPGLSVTEKRWGRDRYSWKVGGRKRELELASGLEMMVRESWSF